MQEPSGPRRAADATSSARHAALDPVPPPTTPRRASPEALAPIAPEPPAEARPIASSSGAARRALAPEPPREAVARFRWPRVFLVVAVIAVTVVVVAYTTFGPHRDATPLPPSPASGAPSPSEVTSAPVKRATTKETVGDATISRPADWELYHDELAEGDRRLIRLRHNPSGVRFQLTTLADLREELPAACTALVTDQANGYAVHALIDARTVLVGDEAEGIVCGFTGTREGDDEATSVSFTLIRRGSDSHTLIVRQMAPVGLDAHTRALEDSAAMACAASITFGHPLPLCSADVD